LEVRVFLGFRLRSNAVVDFPIAVSLIAIGGEMLGKGYEVVPLRDVAEPGS